MTDLHRLFFFPGEVCELRAFGLRGKNKTWGGEWASGVVYGYFDDPEAMSAAAAALDEQALGADGIYFTLNPVLPDLLARAGNRLLPSSNKRPQTSDNQICLIRWLPIDLDPVRPAGISASDQELAAAGEIGRKVREFLENELGWPSGIRGLSGNGYHLVYRLPDLPPGPEVSERGGLVHRALLALAAKFSTDGCKIDSVNYNASRIWKLYGTVARKGDNIAARPHRRSSLFKESPESLEQVAVVSREMLAALAALAPADKSPETQQKAPAQDSAKPVPKQRTSSGQTTAMPSTLGALRVDRYLEHYGRRVTRVKEEPGKQVTRYCLEECVFDQAHKGGESAIVVSPNPPFLTYHCFHESCRSRTWKEAKALISGDDKLAQFCEGYDPNWRPKKQGDTAGSGMLVGQGNGLAGGVVIGSTQVPTPEELDPMEFYVNRGKRAAFAVKLMANYLGIYLHPIVHTSTVFWRYADGIWKEFSRFEINKIVSASLKDLTQPSWFGSAQDVLAADLNLEETQWDKRRNPRYICLKNGMLDLSTQELVAHHPEYWSRVQLPIEFDETATCPLWMKSLAEIFNDVPTKALILQEFFGYIILGTCRYEKMLFMFGTGANGKSTVLNIVEAMVGTENVSSLSLDDMAKSFSIPYLQGKMVNIASEVDTKEKAGTENLKKAVSGDLLTGERKFGDKVTFRNAAKFMFAMNSPPTITDKAHGFARKVIVLNFNRRFADHEMDRTLSGKLAAELPGIFNWALVGLFRLLDQDGFSDLAEVKKETETFMQALNPVLVFISEDCIVQSSCWVSKHDLFESYKEWCGNSLHRAMAKGKFYEQILTQCSGVLEQRKRLDNNSDKAGSRLNVFSGIGLKSVWGKLYGEED